MVSQKTQVLELGTYLLDDKPFSLSPSMITKTQAILGQKESGKTYCAGVLEEEMAEHRLPFIVIDAMGAHIGIKEKYQVVIFGGQRADVPISHDLGREVAKAVVDENVSAVLDISQMNKSQQRRFVAAVCDELYAINTSPRHVFLEEVQEFAPQTVMENARQSFNAIDVMVRLGRQKGLGITMISQRAALINKNILSQAGTFYLFRTVWKADVDTVAELVRDVEGPELAADMRQSLPTQETGVAWVWSPQDLKLFKQIRIRKRTTFHAGATPEFGAIRDLKLVSTDTTALAETFQKIIDLRKEEEDQLAALKRENKKLQRQIDKMGAGEDLKALLRAAIQEDDPRGEGELSTKLTEQLNVTTDELAAAKRQVTDLTTRMELLGEEHQNCDVLMTENDELVRANRTYSEGAAMIREAFHRFGINSQPSNEDTPTPVAVDEEGIVNRVLARISTTEQVHVVSVPPKEALRERFQNEEVERILGAVAGIPPESKKYLLWLIQNEGGTPAVNLLEYVNGRKIPSGGGYQKELRFLRELEVLGLAEAVKGSGWKEIIKLTVRAKLLPYKPSEEALQAVYDQIVGNLASGV